MSVQVVYKSNVKSSNSAIVAIFADEKLNINLKDNNLSKADIIYMNKILKKKKNKKDKIFTINVSDKKTAIIVSLKNNINVIETENLGGEFFSFLKKNNYSKVSIYKDSFNKKNNNLFDNFIHGLTLKSYSFDIYKTKKNTSKIIVFLLSKNKIQKLRRFDALDKAYFILEFGI